MEATSIGVYDSHEKAFDAVKKLTASGFTDKEVSVIWGKEKFDELEKEDRKITAIETAEVGTGVTIGTVLGLLTGVGIFTIPGFGFIYGAGAIVGAIAGADFGLIGGSLMGALSVSGVKEKHHHEKYDAHLKQGHYLLLIQGSKERVEKAKEILSAHAQHIELNVH